MDILRFHKTLINSYKSYIQSFLHIKDPNILKFVDNEIGKKKLWPEPLVQFNPTFEPGRPLADLISEGLLHKDLNLIFEGFKLYRHQDDAISLGARGKEFIVTSGTGSGKSLTFMATIFNHVLINKEAAKDKIQAVIVYPMNALINSQFEELRKFEINYLEKCAGEKIEATNKTPEEVIAELHTKTHKRFPITYGQYTGQEKEDIREKMRNNPPHILLTNYMMLELIMTRGGHDLDFRKNMLANINFLVFDELHTYRGRQGSDVAMLIRRIKAASNKKDKIVCIGTSATMVSGDDTTLLQQREKVAETASTIFGTDITSEQVINEYLVKSIGSGVKPSETELKNAVLTAIDLNAPPVEFEKHATARWIEDEIALEEKEGRWIRRKPTTIEQIAEKLAADANVDISQALQHFEQFLIWANILNSVPGKKRNYLPYRVHQFIAQTGSVFATLGSQNQREYFLDAALYAENKDTMLYPMVFSRNSGHEFYHIKLNFQKSQLLPPEIEEGSDEEDEVNLSEGYVFVQHQEDDEEIWNLERDISELPDTWFNPPRRDGTRSLKREYRERLPQKIYFDKTGRFSFEEPLTFEGWFLSSPMLFDPTSGTIFDRRTGEWTKITKLGGEGRSTATTVLSFETIKQLSNFGQEPEKQKLLSFTDNRQDASLQAGHFNDFVKVGQLRAAINLALEKKSKLDYTNIAQEIFECLNLQQEQYAKRPSAFPGQKKDNEEALQKFIMYRLLYDLRRSWRVIMPNLEQCALLNIQYKHLEEASVDDTLWVENPLLSKMQANERIGFLQQIFDFFRKSYALSFHLLEAGPRSENERIFREKLKMPWALDEKEKLEIPGYVRIQTLAANSLNLTTASAGHQSILGRYIKMQLKKHDIEILGQEEYEDFVYKLFDFLCDKAGYLDKTISRSASNEEINVYRLRVDNIMWQKGDGKNMTPDLIKVRSFKPINLRPNRYFQDFYKTAFNEIKPIEGREHTGQIKNETRQDREKKFRKGEISTLFCSPTMELGIDIADLSIVHMRNVPPTPANYAQRSGRAGRSGQAALVLAYCSNYSVHDRHYFKNAPQMVAGVVSAPRLDLINEELLRCHLNATILTQRSITGLNKSLSEIIDTTQIETLSIKQEVLDVLKFDEDEKSEILINFKRVMEDTYFKKELNIRKPSWYNDQWINENIGSFLLSFDSSMNRWRSLYRASQKQIMAATAIIENRIYADNNEKRKEAYRELKQGERQRDLLLNDNTQQRQNKSEQSEFYPYRYLAAEGFLPGYNFTRLPIRSFMESIETGGEFISRPRFIALQEFGPRNIIYHDGSKYRIDRLIMTEAEFSLKKGKVCPSTGYFLYNEHFDFMLDPIINEELQLDTSRHIVRNMIEMSESRAYEMQRITCQEEERSKKGYQIETYFAVDGGLGNTTEGIVKVGEEKLLHIHYIPACRIFKINRKWRNSPEDGFAINLNTGYWQTRTQQNENNEADEIRTIKLFTSDTANALYIQPIQALPLNGSNGVITLMFAIKRAIENNYQVESNEIAATIMGDEDAPNILIYEAAEGSLGVLSQIVDDPDAFSAIMAEAYRICFFSNGEEKEGEVLPATYDDLLSYYNQYYHQQIDRNLIREAISLLSNAKVEIISNKSFGSYEEQYKFLEATRDSTSSTEKVFLKHLYNNGLKLPDLAQPEVENLFIRPDFFYEPNIYVFCDGTPHDDETVKKEDYKKRKALMELGKRVIIWYYKDNLEALVEKYSGIFKKVK